MTVGLASCEVRTKNDVVPRSAGFHHENKKDTPSTLTIGLNLSFTIQAGDD